MFCLYSKYVIFAYYYGKSKLKWFKKTNKKKDMKRNLQDSSLLFEVFVLIRLGVRKVVNLDSVLIDLIQNLGEKNATMVRNQSSQFVSLEK